MSEPAKLKVTSWEVRYLNGRVDVINAHRLNANGAWLEFVGDGAVIAIVSALSILSIRDKAMLPKEDEA